jgi:hypothetical protein
MAAGSATGSEYRPGFARALADVAIALLLVIIVLALSLSFAMQMMVLKASARAANLEQQITPSRSAAAKRIAAAAPWSR